MEEELKKYNLILKSITNIGKDYYSFDFEKPFDISFISGQYGVFKFTDKEVTGKKFRVFSFASGLNEDTFKIATKIISSPSDFKAKMLELKKGEVMTVDGPMGSFILEESKKAVFIAGGIGITPIRSIIKYIEHINFCNDVQLIFSESESIYPYAIEFKQMSKIKKSCVSGIEETQNAISKAINIYGNEAVYYIAGSPGFVSGIKGQLIDSDIVLSNIKFDRFSGL
jgi:ferredoxin-NADP reductase